MWFWEISVNFHIFANLVNFVIFREFCDFSWIFWFELILGIRRILWFCGFCVKNETKIDLSFFLEKSAAHEPWFVIDFCQLGFIGKMFSSSSLPLLIQFLLSFYNDKPGDWLLDNVIQTKVCKLDQDFKKCQKEKQALWIHYKPSLFQVSI